MDVSQDRPVAKRATAAARRVFFGFGPREIGIGAVGLAILLGGGAVLARRSSRASAGADEIVRGLAAVSATANDYRVRIAALQKQAAQARAAARMERTEPDRTWLRERAQRYDALVAAVDRQSVTQRFAADVDEISALVRRGEVAGARRRLYDLAPPRFPPAAEFDRLKAHLYDASLAAFSRQNPQSYRAFRQYEPEASRRDELALRAEIAAAGEAVTPQLIAKVDLLAAVAAADDPVVARWAERASALEYFEAPDAATLARWDAARRAARAADWPLAAAEMQAILKSTIRTRQPFRAALGRALLKSRPDRPGDAYGFLVEAANAGDKEARAWVANEDLRSGRYADARRGLEARVADGEADAVPALVIAYERAPDAADPAKTAGALERITDRGDAPADAWLLLGLLYERADPDGSAAARAYACYARAAAQGSAKARVQAARCALNGTGTPRSPDRARENAAEAFARGEREAAAPILLTLMRDSPDRTAQQIQRLFGEDSVAGGGGYAEAKTVDGPGVAALKTALARYLDQQGDFGAASRLYAGLRDPASSSRHAELTAGHSCETCGGSGKVVVPVPCPTCGGKGSQICSFCAGAGFIYVPGTPPCGSCGGTGTLIQNRKVLGCAACGGTGKGKGSVVKQDCPHCDQGRIRCSDCTGGVINNTKECPDCHGRGAWTLAERGRG